jgi:hypothetical protein
MAFEALLSVLGQWLRPGGMGVVTGDARQLAARLEALAPSKRGGLKPQIRGERRIQRRARLMALGAKLHARRSGKFRGLPNRPIPFETKLRGANMMKTRSVATFAADAEIIRNRLWKFRRLWGIPRPNFPQLFHICCVTSETAIAFDSRQWSTQRIRSVSGGAMARRRIPSVGRVIR